jgi:hypothetical protein
MARYRAATFARRSAVGALALGTLGQVVYHLLAAAGATRAPWSVVVLVSCMPVVTLGFGAALTHLLRVAWAPGPYTLLLWACRTASTLRQSRAGRSRQQSQRRPSPPPPA